MKSLYCICLMILFITNPFGNCMPRRKRLRYTKATKMTTIQTNATTPILDPTTGILRRFCIATRKRLSLEADVARACWKRGTLVDVTKKQYVEILERADIQARNLSMEPGVATQFMTDLFEASNIIRYTLISDWYANVTHRDGIVVPRDDKNTSLKVVKNKLKQNEINILQHLAQLEHFRTNEKCNKRLGRMVFEVMRDVPCTLNRIALQRSMCNFCKFFKSNKNPFEVLGVTVKTVTVPTKKHWTIDTDRVIPTEELDSFGWSVSNMSHFFSSTEEE